MLQLLQCTGDIGISMEDVINSISKSPSTLLDKPGSSNVALDDPVELDTLIESSLQKVISFCRDKSLKEVSHVLNIYI